MPLAERNWLVVLAANHVECCVECEANEKPCCVEVTKAVWTQWLSKVGCVWDDTLQRFKGPACRLGALWRKVKNALSKSGQVFTPSHFVQIMKVCGLGCSAALLVKATQSPLASYTHFCSLRGHLMTKCWPLGYTNICCSTEQRWVTSKCYHIGFLQQIIFGQRSEGGIVVTPWCWVGHTSCLKIGDTNYIILGEHGAVDREVIAFLNKSSSLLANIPYT